MRFPCAVCYKLVHVNQRALQCDLCTYWCHCVWWWCRYLCLHYNFQSSEAFNWPCPRCIADVMPFHDCSVLSCFSSDTFETVSQYQSFNFPNLSSPACLRIAHLNCRSLFIADEVFDLFIHNCMDVLLPLRYGWTLQLMVMRFFLAPHLSLQYKMIKIISGGVAFLLLSRVKFF